VSRSPEDARLASCGPRDVTLYSRPGCHLCEEAKAAMAPLLREFGLTLHEVNIDADPALQERYGWDIPVIFIGQHKAAKHRIDVTQFRKQLQQTAAR
jgi:glutaredoxin